MKLASNNTFLRITCSLILLCVLPAAQAQEGHPLSGTWLGGWGSTTSDEHFLTLIMQWDGTRISVLANPGPNSTDTGAISLNAEDWSVRIEMPMKDDEGNEVAFKAEGQLDQLGSQTRSMNGTWEGNGQHGTFTLTRQSGA